MKTFILAASALGLMAFPAQAQILGGIGHPSASGTLNGTIGSTLRVPTDTLRTATQGTLRGSAATSGAQSVDRRSGNVSVERNADTAVDANASQVLGNSSLAGSGSANAAGSGSADARLLGTDAVAGIVQSGAGRVQDAATSVRGSAAPLSSTANGLAGSASGSAGGSANSAGMLDSGIFALAGTVAARGDGAFAVTPGMPVVLPTGETLGSIRDVATTRSGEVRQLLVDTANGVIAVAGSDLSVSGGILVAGEATGSVTSAASAE